MHATFQSFLLTLSLAAGAALAGCASTPPEKKPDLPPVTMTPLPPLSPTPPAVADDPVVRPAVTPPPAASEALYHVLAGDTGFKIARKYHLSLSDLQALNPGVRWDRLRVGQLVRIRSER
ncbi:MAG: LysM domain-containing protein [Verrucomicrobia bacterium]|nr:LysM domain-containing protein [Verrucomicrobiota bacterium]